MERENIYFTVNGTVLDTFTVDHLGEGGELDGIDIDDYIEDWKEEIIAQEIAEVEFRDDYGNSYQSQTVFAEDLEEDEEEDEEDV